MTTQSTKSNPNATSKSTLEKPIVIVGAGAAGIGIAITLKKLKLPFVIIDKNDVGASFKNWSPQTRFISPSFTGNAFGQVDLNAVTPDTSPAFTLRSEHPTGKEYASYLTGLVNHLKLPVITGVEVYDIKYESEYFEPFTIHTEKGDIVSQYVIWAAGEYQYPNRSNFKGASLCTHYADVRTWEDVVNNNQQDDSDKNTDSNEDTIYVIGGYESGIDAVYQLIKLGKKVVLFDGENQLDKHGSDSSYTLSPFTRDRLNEVVEDLNVWTANITEVTYDEGVYTIRDEHGQYYKSRIAPIDCTGFVSSLGVVEDLFDFEDNNIVLNNYDESTRCPNLFLSGPQVRHGLSIFCFIYKYRQRFGVVGASISKRVNGDSQAREQLIADYRKANFFLDDLSCCEDECVC